MRTIADSVKKYLKKDLSKKTYYYKARKNIFDVVKKLTDEDLDNLKWKSIITNEFLKNDKYLLYVSLVLTTLFFFISSLINVFENTDIKIVLIFMGIFYFSIWYLAEKFLNNIITRKQKYRTLLLGCIDEEVEQRKRKKPACNKVNKETFLINETNSISVVKVRKRIRRNY